MPLRILGGLFSPFFPPPMLFLAEAAYHVAMPERQFRGERGGGELRKATKGEIFFLSLYLPFSLSSSLCLLYRSIFFCYFLPSSLTEMSGSSAPFHAADLWFR